MWRGQSLERWSGEQYQAFWHRLHHIVVGMQHIVQGWLMSELGFMVSSVRVCRSLWYDGEWEDLEQAKTLSLSNVREAGTHASYVESCDANPMKMGCRGPRCWMITARKERDVSHQAQHRVDEKLGGIFMT